MYVIHLSLSLYIYIYIYTYTCTSSRGLCPPPDPEGALHLWTSIRRVEACVRDRRACGHRRSR